MKEKFKVVLINPSNNEAHVGNYAPTEHLGLAYLTAVLRQEGYWVKIIDAYALNITKEEVIEEVTAIQPNFVGITAEYNTIEVATYLIKTFREKLEGAHLSMGGQHATFSANELLSEVTELDSILRGEGEITIVEVMNRLHDGKSLDGILGAYYRGVDGSVLKNGDRPAIADLDSLPFPARDTLIECQKRGITPAISVLSSRGCQANCSFCNASKYFSLGGGNKWRGRSPENIVDEIEELKRVFGDTKIYDVVYFSDENFVGPGQAGLDRVADIADEIKNRNIDVSYEIFCRADSFNNREDLVRKLSESGLISALIGLESGYQKSLNKFSKGTTVNSNLNTIELFKKYRIITSSSGFLMFNPYSTFEEIEENAKFLLKIGMSTLYNMSLKVLGYPGLRYVQQLEDDELLTEDFSHKNVEGYKFKDSRLKDLVKAVAFDESLGRREDSSHRYLDISLTDLDRKLCLTEYMDNESLKKGRSLVEDSRFTSQLVTYNFFIKLVSLAEMGWSEDIFTKYKKRYIVEIDEALNSMNLVYENYIDLLNEIIE